MACYPYSDSSKKKKPSRRCNRNTNSESHVLMKSIVAVEVLRGKKKRKEEKNKRAVIVPRIPNIGIMLALNGLKIGKRTQAG